jgi:LysM repeat protein
MSPQNTVARPARPALTSVRVVTRSLTVVPDTDVFARLPITPVAGFPRTSQVRTPPVRLVAVGRPPQGGPAPARSHLRLTRRGRVVLLGLLAAVTLAVMLAVLSLGRVSSLAATGVSPPVSHGTVVVQPGDTLWSIASRIAPNADPRVLVQRIIDLNALRTAVLQPGEELALPS